MNREIVNKTQANIDIDANEW